MRLGRVILFLLSVAIASVSARSAHAFKVKMHIRTANVAMYDAMDGAICMPGFTGHMAEDGKKPPQIPLGNTALQHFWSEYNEQGQIQTSYRTWLLQYAPYVRAGAVGPDGFPDMLVGQLFVHANHASPYDCEGLSEGECMDLKSVNEGPSAIDQALDFGSEQLSSLMQFAPSSPKGSKTDLIKKTFFGKPEWRSVDWGHEVMYRALRYHDDRLLDKNGLPNLELTDFDRMYYMEEKRAAVAFAMGYFMHMIGDGQIHNFINQLVAMPWSYFDTRTPGHPSYGPLSVIQEELQHMATEGYINSLYYPGTEPIETMSHVDGLACEPFVPKDNIELQCIPDEVLRPIQVEDCNRCNPLRSINPAEVNTRCDHCFGTCNPWKEICAPTLPGDGFICPESEVCRTQDAELEACLTNFKDKPLELNKCRRTAISKCTDAKESCACNKSVKVLKDMKIIPQDTIEGTCLSADAKKLSEEAQGFMQGLFNVAKNTFSDQEYSEDVRQALERQLAAGQCDTRPLDMRRTLGAGLIPDQPLSLQIKDENGDVVEDATFEPHGYVLDLNENGKADLLNECVLINCRINPHECPYNALDWELPNEQITDAIPCRTIPSEDGFQHVTYDSNACDSGLFSAAAIDVDMQKLVNADRADPIVEHFLNSNYMAVPKKFVASVFYTDRRYHDMPERPSHTSSGAAPAPRQPQDFAPTMQPGEFGTYSLGGYPVNAVHSMSDLLRLMTFYTRVSITDAIALARQADPNNTVFQFIDRVPQIIDKAVGYLRQIAKAFRENVFLNFEIKNPFTGNVLVRVDLGQRLSAATLILADHLAHILPSLQAGADRIMADITSGLTRRMSKLRNHIQWEWPKVTTCLSEFANSGEGRFYAIDRVKQFMGDAFSIMITGAVSCTQPPIVTALLKGNVPNVQWNTKTVDELMQASGWVVCQVESIILQRFYMQVLLPAYNKLFEETTKRFICPLVGIDVSSGKDLLSSYFKGFAGNNSSLQNQLNQLIGQAPDTKEGLDTACFEAVELIYNPASMISPLAEYALGKLDFAISTTPPLQLRDFYRNIRMISTGTCWDGALGSAHITDRDRVRAAFGDFAITDESGTALACPDNQKFFTDLGLSEASKAKTPTNMPIPEDDPLYLSDPVWSVLKRARDQEFAIKLNPTPPPTYDGAYDTTDPVIALSRKRVTPYRQFMLPNPSDDPTKVPRIYENDWEFDARPGGPVVKTLDKLMNAPDPYSQPRYTRRIYDKRTQQFSTEPVHLMNSVGFNIVYNTMQLNKLSFMGPGSPGKESCMIDEAQCLKDNSKDSGKCQTLARECNIGATGASVPYGMGLRSMIAFANLLDPTQLGSGKHGWRDPRDLFHDIEPIKETGSNNEVLGELFQEQFLSKHQPDESHPGHRTCKSLNFHPMCNSVYDLDDPDQYCRQTHAWAYQMMEELGDIDNVTWDVLDDDYGVIWPEIDRTTYLNELRRLGIDVPYAEFWPKKSHESCFWLTNSDRLQMRHYLHDLTPRANALTDIKAPYSPDNTRADLIPNLRQRDPTKELQVNWDGNEAWAHADHAKDYNAAMRSFSVDTNRRVIAADAKSTATEEGGFVPSPSDRSYTPTRFFLANKDSHVARMYSKILAPHYCPLSPDQADVDCDGIPDLCDNCPRVYNPEQQNSTNRGAWSFEGDACRGLEPIVQDLRCAAPTPPKDAASNGSGTCNCSTVPSPPRGTVSMILLLLGLVCWRRKTQRSKRCA